MKIEGVIFDMDGVVLNTEHWFLDSWHKVEEQFGFAVNWDLVPLLLGANDADASRVFTEICGSREMADRVNQWQLDTFYKESEQYGIQLMPGFLELLAYLQKEKIPMVLASSTTMTGILESFKKCPIENPFTHIISGDMVTHSKPNPEIFLRAADMIGVPIANCLILEDSYNGVYGGLSAGAITIMIPDTLPATDDIKAKAYRVCESLNDIIPIIKKSREQS